MGITNIEKWNEAVVENWLWHVANHSKSLWVRWVHGVYTKGGNWIVFNPPITTSWSFNTICRIKDKLGSWIVQNKYNIRDVYQDNFRALPKVTWSRFVWNRASTPKSKFIFLLIALDKLKTKSKRFHMKLVDDDQCPMCLSTVETIDHLFFTCPFSARRFKELCTWLQLYKYPLMIPSIINYKWKTPCFQRKVIIASIYSLCYYI